MRTLLMLVTAVAVALCACTGTPERAPAAPKLTASDSILIAVPADAVRGKTTYVDSGMMTTRALYAAFAKRTQRASTAHAVQPFAQALAAARAAGKQYLIYPTIEYWIEQTPESRNADRVEIRIVLASANSSEPIITSVVRERSRRQMPAAIERFVASLYGESQ